MLKIQQSSTVIKRREEGDFHFSSAENKCAEAKGTQVFGLGVRIKGR